MKHLLFALFTILSIPVLAQTVAIEGYIYETGNRGYLNNVDISIEDLDTDRLITKATTNEEGFFSAMVPINSNLRLYATKEMFDVKKVDVKIESKKAFVKLAMGRAPGYKFEVTLAEKRDNENIIVDAIKGARIEVYNNTEKTSIMDLKDHQSPEFQMNLEKGNHYTILIRKEGYLSKRMEAKVNVEGCILCFEGVGRVDPGVTDNLSGGNAMGVLLANVELERIFEGKKMEVQNLYYATNKWKLDRSARRELNKVITLMKDNPNLTLELGSHTDSQGKADGNRILSQKRAKAAAEYLIDKGGIAKARIVSRGYGEQILLNECSDGVKCGPEQHAKNRRTELKIVGITNVAMIKSLKKMKEEEHMEAEILELMDQEEVKIYSEEELAELKKKNKEEINEIQNQETEEIKEQKSSMPDLSEFTKKEEVEKKETVKERIAREKAVLLAKKEAKQNNPVRTSTEKTGRDVNKYPDTESTERVVKVLDDMPGLEVIDDKSKKSEGYKVVIHSGNIPLRRTHEIFKTHDKVEFHMAENGKMYYMLTGYKTLEEAKKYHSAFIRKKYRKSFVAEFKNGIVSAVEE